MPVGESVSQLIMEGTAATTKRKLFPNSPLSDDEKRQKLSLEQRENWDVESVGNFLEENGFGDLKSKFLAEKISGLTLSELTEDHLLKIGVKEMGTRLDVLKLLKEPPVTNGHVHTPAENLEKKVFNDPIHGHIELHPLCVRVVDTPQFQRLRFIRQLGGNYYVFPGATHHRFEHSVGVSYLAGKLVRILQSQQPELRITEEDVLCVELAGLCHDLGHGPFSHMFDGRFIPRVNPQSTWKHEQASADMFDHLVEVNDLKKVFYEYGLGERDLVFIKEQITGPTNKTGELHGRDPEKQFLYQIVANKMNSIDVDKWDYFARDCHHLGIKNSFDHDRFMMFVRVIQTENGRQICSREKEVYNIFDMFNTRSTLHRRAYQHRVTNIIEWMFTDVLILADDHIKIKGSDGKVFKISTAIKDMEAYTKLNDTIFNIIEFSDDPNLDEARALLKRIHSRQLYKCVGQANSNTEEGRKKLKKIYMQTDLPGLLEEIVSGASSASLTRDDVVLDLVTVDFGMKAENPIDRVQFYRKNNYNQAFTLRPQDLMLGKTIEKTQFIDQCLRFIVKDSKNSAVAEKLFDAWCDKNFMNKQLSSDQIGILTPVKSSCPSQCSQASTVDLITEEEEEEEEDINKTPEPESSNVS